MTYTEFKEIANNAGYITSEKSGLCIAEAVGRNNKIIIDKCKVKAVYIDNDICNSEDFEVIKAAIALAETPLGEREEEKIYIIPLPHLVTSDGKKQYLTQLGTFFACRRDKTLIQTWEEKDLVHVPEEYRGFAVEIEVEE